MITKIEIFILLISMVISDDKTVVKDYIEERLKKVGVTFDKNNKSLIYFNDMALDFNFTNDHQKPFICIIKTKKNYPFTYTITSSDTTVTSKDKIWQNFLNK